MEEKTGKDKKEARRIGHGEERSAGQVKPSKLSKSELEKFGVTYKDTAPAQDGVIERKVAPRLVCNQCGQSWRVPSQKDNRPLPDGYWVCPKGCNKQ